jgi:hypothetical protein
MSNPKSTLPMPGLSKRAQELLKPRPHQIVLTPKNQADKTRAILKGGI